MSGTKIVGRQIADGAVTDAKIPAGAGIATSKLADGANFIKRDGTVAFTGAVNLGNQRITAVGTPTAGGDASNKSYVDTAIANLNSLFDAKPSAKTATTGDITPTESFAVTQDGVALAVGDILFVRAQANPAENGLYIVQSFSAINQTVVAARHETMNAWEEIPGAFFAVEQGATFGDTIWLCTANQGGTLGTTAVTFFQIPTSAGLGASNFVDKEVPSGVINGANTTFSIAYAPVSNSEHVWLNGILQESGAGNDYSISGATLTLTTAPLAGEKLRVSYRK